MMLWLIKERQWPHVVKQNCSKESVSVERETGAWIENWGDNESISALRILKHLRNRVKLTMLCGMERALTVSMLSAARQRMSGLNVWPSQRD